MRDMVEISREDRERYDIPHLDEIQKEKLEREKENGLCKRLHRSTRRNTRTRNA